MKKKQWVVPSMMAGLLLASIMTGEVLYQNNLIPSFRTIASEEVVINNLEELKKQIDIFKTDSEDLKKRIDSAAKDLKEAGLTSQKAKIIKEEQVLPITTDYRALADTSTELNSKLNNLELSEKFTEEIKAELLSEINLISESTMEHFSSNSKYTSLDKLTYLIDKLKDEEADSRIKELETKVCEQTNKVSELIEVVKELVEDQQKVAEEVEYSYDLNDLFSYQNGMLGNFMDPFMMYNPFSMSSMSPFHMMSPFSMPFTNFGFPGAGSYGRYGISGFRGIGSRLSAYESNYYELPQVARNLPEQVQPQGQVPQSAFGVNYSDLRLGDDFLGNVNLEGGQNIMKIPQYSRGIVQNGESISVLN